MMLSDLKLCGKTERQNVVAVVAVYNWRFCCPCPYVRLQRSKGSGLTALRVLSSCEFGCVLPPVEVVCCHLLHSHLASGVCFQLDGTRWLRSHGSLQPGGSSHE